MHLTRRSYVLVMLTAVIAIAGIWSSDRTLERVWRVPAALLLLGLAIDGLRVRRLQPQVRIATAVPAFLGRAQPGAFVFTNGAARALAFEYVPLTPPGFEVAGAVRELCRIADLSSIVCLAGRNELSQKTRTMPASASTHNAGAAANNMKASPPAVSKLLVQEMIEA